MTDPHTRGSTAAPMPKSKGRQTLSRELVAILVLYAVLSIVPLAIGLGLQP